jgi:hypothetical protein
MVSIVLIVEVRRRPKPAISWVTEVSKERTLAKAPCRRCHARIAAPLTVADRRVVVVAPIRMRGDRRFLASMRENVARRDAGASLIQRKPR